MELEGWTFCAGKSGEGESQTGLGVARGPRPVLKKPLLVHSSCPSHRRWGEGWAPDQ